MHPRLYFHWYSIPVQPQKRWTKMEKRRHQRMTVDNLLADISDGMRVFHGTVTDVSRFGLKLDEIPKKLDDRAKRLSIVVSGEGKNFKMKARPRWASRQSISKKIGIEIINAPWGWTEFVMDSEPETDDIWGKITI